MGEDSEKALAHLREGREKIEICRRNLIYAQSDFKQALLIMERLSNGTDLNDDKLEDELDKMKSTVEGLNALAADIDKLYFKEAATFRVVTKRAEKCRKARVDSDSGFISRDSSMMQPEETDPGSSTMIAQATKDPEGKHCSDSFNFSSSVLRTEITDTTVEACDHGGTTVEAVSGTVRSVEGLSSDHAVNELLLNVVSLGDDAIDSPSKDVLQAYDSTTESVTVANEDAVPDLERTEQNDDDEAACTGESKDKSLVCASTGFAAYLGEDKQFHQAQGNHQKTRHKKSNDKFNSL